MSKLNGHSAPTFGRYRDAVILGRGGMGSVYRAVDPSLDRYVAIKVLTQRAPRYVERFRREAQVLAKIAHPSIIRIYEIVGTDDDAGDPYIVMEYFDGQPLDHAVEQGPLSCAQVTSIVRQAAAGLRKAHENNVIHRDVKPANLMLSESGVVKILDFGIAKLRDAKVDLTGSLVLGTPYYMSPEQAMGLPIDARSDIYSLGLTAFHLITGRKPFEAKSKVDVMLMQVKAPLPEIQKLARCDERVARIVEKMCAKKPADRYRDCGELIAALDALPHPNAQPPGARSNGKPLATPSAPERASARGPGRRMWIGVAAGAAAAVALLVSLGLALVGGGGGAPTGRVPTAGWVPGAGLRKVQARGGYGNCVFSPAAVARGVEDASSLRAIFTAGEPIHGRCFFARSLGSGRRGELWQELWVDGVKRGQISYDGVLPPGEDQLAISVSGPHAARIRELSAGKHTLDIWIYRQPDGTDHRIPLAAGELVVRK
jgi:predicted Ser/Thr protein kinase